MRLSTAPPPAPLWPEASGAVHLPRIGYSNHHAGSWHIEFSKSEATKHHVQYQRTIRRLADL